MGRAEGPEFVGDVDHLLEGVHHELGEEPLGRVDVSHDRVGLAAVADELAQPHVDVVNLDPLATGERNRLTTARHARLGHTRREASSA
jgi:hypothetical protein